MNDISLKVNQYLHTIQGEGPKTGVPSVLLRLADCNCHCPFCDSKYSWNGGVDNYSSFDHDNIDDLIKTLKKSLRLIPNLMITGGEPLLYKDNPFFTYIFERVYDYFDSIEIETNGSLLDNNFITNFKYTNRTYFNISPKLNPKYYKNEADYDNLFENINNLTRTPTNLNYIIKFVDIHRDMIEKFIKETNLPRRKINMMPLTPDRTRFENKSDFRKVYLDNCRQTMEYCLTNGYTFIPRMHVFLFDDKNETIVC